MLKGRGLRNESGAVAVEGAITAITFFVIFMATVNLSLYLYRVVGVEWALSEGLRFAAIGTNTPLAVPSARATRIRSKVQELAQSVGASISNPNCIRVCSQSVGLNCPVGPTCPGIVSQHGGAPEELVRISVRARIPLLFGFGNIDYISEVLGLTEDFS